MKTRVQSLLSNSTRTATAREHDCPWDPADGGGLHNLGDGVVGRIGGVCAIAALGGHFETLRWARDNGCEWNALTTMFAARGGHFEILKYLRWGCISWMQLTRSSKAPRFSPCRPCAYKAKITWFQLLPSNSTCTATLRQNDCPWDGDCLACAAASGNVEMLAWCCDNG